MSNDRTEHCLTRDLCKEVDSVLSCPHYNEGYYYPHFKVINESESYQCSDCTTGAEARPCSGVRDLLKEMERFLRRGFIDYSKTITEEIDLEERTYTIMTGLNTAHPTPIRLHLREDAKVGALDCLRLWAQRLTSEDEIESVNGQLEILLSKLRTRGDKESHAIAKSQALERLQRRRGTCTINLSASEAISLLRNHIQRNIRTGLSGPPARTDVTIRIAIRESELAILAAAIQTSIDGLEHTVDNFQVRRMGNGGRRRNARRNVRHLPPARITTNNTEDQANTQEREDTRRGQHNDGDLHDDWDTVCPDSMSQELPPLLNIHPPYKNLQHSQLFDEMEAYQRDYYFDCQTTRRLRGPL
ncbi:hypothetical protein F4814DRAFT_445309 [Daldinia grandis]|nr:hypothetical protein F4814DRAFT_445309 [Daldinia grandis]